MVLKIGPCTLEFSEFFTKSNMTGLLSGVSPWAADLFMFFTEYGVQFIGDFLFFYVFTDQSKDSLFSL